MTVKKTSKSAKPAKKNATEPKVAVVKAAKIVKPAKPVAKPVATPTKPAAAVKPALPVKTAKNSQKSRISDKLPIIFRPVSKPVRTISASDQAVIDQIPVKMSGNGATIEEITVEELSGEEQLINIGREKGYVTYEDILGFFPDAEKNLDQLEDLFAALTDAGISIVASEDEGAEQLIDDDDDEDDEWNERNNENLLEAIEADDTVGLYLKEIGRVALLTAPQEVDLAQRMERGREARETIISGEKVLPKDKERLDSLIDDGMAAREHLINANSRLVISVAKKYIGRGVPFLGSDPGRQYRPDTRRQEV